MVSVMHGRTCGILIGMVIALAGCQRHARVVDAGPPLRSFPAVARLETRELSGSITPISAHRGLTTQHVYKSPIAWIDGTLSGIDLESCGDAADGPAGDWAILGVEDTELPGHNVLVSDYPFCKGETVYIAGYSDTNETGTATLVKGTVTGLASDNEGVIVLRVEGSTNLSEGATGGPAAVWSQRDGWRVVGIYLGRWTGSSATGSGTSAHAILPLPIDAFAPAPEPVPVIENTWKPSPPTKD